MRIPGIIEKIFFLTLFLFIGSCEPEQEPDPCLKTKWLNPKEYEIKLAVKISETNPQLPGGTAGSLNPIDFQEMLVNGTIENVECNEETTGPVTLGNSYITKGEDLPASIEGIENAYWIGHVVYVYEFDNDGDKLMVNLKVQLTMSDGQSYKCTYNEELFFEDIERVPGELYYYILLDIYSQTWIKV